MKFILLHALLIGALTTNFACKSKQKTEATVAPTATATANQAADRTTNDDKAGRGKGPRYMIVQIERTSCYGKCPSYKARIWNDGVAEYEGKAHVERIGKFTATVTPETIQKLSKIADKTNFIANVEKRAALPPTPAPSDLPALKLYYNNGEKESFISLKGVDAPEFKDFTDATEKTMNDIKWVKSE